MSIYRNDFHWLLKCVYQAESNSITSGKYHLLPNQRLTYNEHDVGVFVMTCLVSGIVHSSEIVEYVTQEACQRFWGFNCAKLPLLCIRFHEVNLHIIPSWSMDTIFCDTTIIIFSPAAIGKYVVSRLD